MRRRFSVYTCISYSTYSSIHPFSYQFTLLLFLPLSVSLSFQPKTLKRCGGGFLNLVDGMGMELRKPFCFALVCFALYVCTYICMFSQMMVVCYEAGYLLTYYTSRGMMSFPLSLSFWSQFSLDVSLVVLFLFFIYLCIFVVRSCSSICLVSGFRRHSLPNIRKKAFLFFSFLSFCLAVASRRVHAQWFPISGFRVSWFEGLYIFATYILSRTLY